MATEAVPIGMLVTLKANQIYALPAVGTTLFTDAASPTIAQSNSLTFATSYPLTITAGVSKVYGAFIRATADTVVVLKRD